jgi:hypothetical protein
MYVRMHWMKRISRVCIETFTYFEEAWTSSFSIEVILLLGLAIMWLRWIIFSSTLLTLKSSLKTNKRTDIFACYRLNIHSRPTLGTLSTKVRKLSSEKTPSGWSCYRVPSIHTQHLARCQPKLQNSVQRKLRVAGELESNSDSAKTSEKKDAGNTKFWNKKLLPFHWEKTGKTRWIRVWPPNPRVSNSLPLSQTQAAGLPASQFSPVSVPNQDWLMRLSQTWQVLQHCCQPIRKVIEVFTI